LNVPPPFRDAGPLSTTTVRTLAPLAPLELELLELELAPLELELLELLLELLPLLEVELLVLLELLPLLLELTATVPLDPPPPQPAIVNSSSTRVSDRSIRIVGSCGIAGDRSLDGGIDAAAIEE
jgi:hypothetical protein